MSATPAKRTSSAIILPTSTVVHASVDHRDQFGQYSIVVAILDDEGLKPLKLACGATYRAKFGGQPQGQAVKPYKQPDAVDDDLTGTLLVSAKSKRQPKLFDRDRQPVADPVLLRGDKVMISVVPYAWSRDGRTGVTLQVRGIMLVERGGDDGIADAEQDFEGVEVPEAVSDRATGEGLGADDDFESASSDASDEIF